MIKKSNHVITDVGLQKGNHQGDTLWFLADGKEVTVCGEFWIKEGNLHHTHIFDDGEEYEIVIPYKNVQP